jgi:imidazolonepropionase
MSKTILIRHAKSVLQTREMPNSPLRGAHMAQLPSRQNASLFIRNGIVERILDASDPLPEADVQIDASNRFVLPCWCDSHTHLVYAHSRETEFVDRINGLSYEEIARRGGGILNSAHRLHDATEDELYESAWGRLQEIIGYGTGAVEIKSGYGLNTADELKMLRTIRRLKENSPIPIKATFLGAHAIPLEYQKNREGYVKLIIEEMLPLISGEGLADYIDVFCETGFFTPQETERILKAGSRYGLRPKVHVNQLSNIGGVQVGISQNALSVDHLEQIGPEEIELIGNNDVVATLLPSCSFFINIPYAPARALIDADAAVVIASDYNPGSTPSGKIPFLLSLACIKMRMTPAEAINAVTINGAHAMELHNECGTIAEGRPAFLILTKPMQSLAYIPYAFGSDHIEKVVLPHEVRNIN